MMFPLEIAHVSKSYGPNVVLDDLTFTVEPGRVTGFLGPNGAGKSTLMKILIDLAAADHGTATIGGRRYRTYPEPARTVGVVLEPNAFHPSRSGRNHLAVMADAAGIPTSRVEEMLHLVRLGDASDRKVGAYSLGMRQRLGIAAALLGDPPVVVLDEPGNGLDPQGIRWLRDLLRARAADGNTVFVSSHLLAEVEHLAHDVVVINQGRLVAHGAIDDLQQTAVTVRTPDPERLAAILQDSGATVHPHDWALTVRGLTATQIGDTALVAGIAIHELTPRAGSLEDLFLDWTQPDRAVAAARQEVMSR